MPEQHQLILKGVGHGHRILANRIAESDILTYDADGTPLINERIKCLTISFRGLKSTDKISIQEIATLALLARRVAEEGKRVLILLPQAKERKSRISSFLSRLGFFSLLKPEFEQETWNRNIRLQPTHPKVTDDPPSSSSVSYLPLRWITIKSFSVTESENIWEARPNISPQIEQDFTHILNNHGLVDETVVDLLNRTLFVELGWNVILHSSCHAGNGLGVFCGHVDTWKDSNGQYLPPKFSFCLADLGRGIPATLRAAYRSCTNPKLKFHLSHPISEDTAIVRFALEANTTSRPKMPSKVDEEGFRGLAFVASAIQEYGVLKIQSKGGEVKLTGTPQGTKIELTKRRERSTNAIHSADSFEVIPGTRIVGTLMSAPNRDLPKIPLISDRAPLTGHTIHLLAELDGGGEKYNTEEKAIALIDSITEISSIIIFDLGYSDEGPRSLEYLVKAAFSRFKANWLVFWHVRTTWSQLDDLNQWLAANPISILLPPLFFHSSTSSRILGGSYDPLRLRGSRYDTIRHWLSSLFKTATSADSLPGQPVRLSSRESLALTREVNSAYIDQGFRLALDPTITSDPQRSGFYVGAIHLLRGGKPAQCYFSITNNLIAPRDSNRRRWTEACYEALNSLIEEYDGDDSALVLLGYTATIRDIFADTCSRLNRQFRAYAMLTYDVPSREEIASKVQPGDTVVLVTDVISTGTLTDAVASLISRVAAKVLGAVCLVETRGRPTSSSHSVRVVSGAELRSRARSQATLSEKSYWVDPVSLIPNRERGWGWNSEINKKIEKSLKIIFDAGASVCGHITDGSRHSSVYINISKLLVNQELATQESAFSAIRTSLSKRGWTDFAPATVIFPAGISRIETLATTKRAANDPTSNVFATAVRLYVERLQLLWPEMRPIEVSRAFDPGGGARCARTIELPEFETEGHLGDIVIADDGIWKGTTITALLQLAVRLGAKRILIAPLLARIQPTDIEHLESQHAITGPDGSYVVETAYTFPMVFPVPYYGSNECPYEITLERINRSKASRLHCSEKVIQSIVEELRPRTPSDCRGQSDAYVTVWTRLRVYSELASHHEEPLEKLIDVIETSSECEHLQALFDFFSQEWRILEVSRLRQTARPALRAKAVCVVSDDKTPLAVLTSAMTVLRCLFRDDYVEMLRHLPHRIASNCKVSARIVFQIASLADEWRSRSACSRFLDELGDQLSADMLRNGDNLSMEEVQTSLDLLVDCKNTSLEIRLEESRRPMSVQDSAQHLFYLLSQDTIFRHQTVPFIETIANSRESINELDKPSLESQANEWETEHLPRIKADLLPLIQNTKSILMRVGSQGHRFIDTDLRFLDKNCEEIVNDLGGLSTSLVYLAGRPNVSFVQETAVASAESLMLTVFARNSRLIELLSEMRGEVVMSVIRRFRGEIEAKFRTLGRPLSVELEGIEQLVQDDYIFAPSDVLSYCFANIIDNLVKYAFPEQSPTARVLLRVGESRDKNGMRLIDLAIYNNGLPIDSKCVIGQGAKRAIAELQVFGGVFYPAEAANIQPWCAMHRMTLLTWK